VRLPHFYKEIQFAKRSNFSQNLLASIGLSCERAIALSGRTLIASMALAVTLALQIGPTAAQMAPPAGAAARISSSGPDAGSYGEGLGYPTGLPFKRQQNMVGNYSRYDSLFPTHSIAASERPFRFERAPDEIKFTYNFRSETHDLASYLARNPTTGFLIVRDDTILFEHYQYGRTDHDRFTSQSMAKTITSMLVGIVIGEGAIHSVDDLAQTYVPELTGTEYGKTPIRALLHMASGVAFTQTYGGSDDDAKLNRVLFSRSGPGAVAALAEFNKRIAPPDTLWNYANANTEVLGLVLTHATHQTLAELLRTRIWQPMGAEADAKWGIDNSGQEIAYCCFNATLRDYARFALLLAHDGAWNGKQLIPHQWLLDATTPVSQGSFLAVSEGPHPWGYGYQVWLMPGPRRTFVLEGIEGQRIFVDPETHLVLAHTAVRLKPTHDPGEFELIALWRSALAQIGHE
jgi:CubicO group peptidase (beta-lactamase class C family)